MKSFSLLFFVFFLLNCTSTTESEHESTENQSELVIEIEIEMYSSIPIGYANTYKCAVLNVLYGELAMDTFVMTIMAGDHQNQDYISQHFASTVFEASYHKYKENEPYSMVPITGFVDGDMTSWELDSIVGIVAD